MDAFDSSVLQLFLTESVEPEPGGSLGRQQPQQDLLLVAGDGGVLTAVAIDVLGSRLVPIDSVHLPSARAVQPWAGIPASDFPNLYTRCLRVDPEGRAAALAASGGRIVVVLLNGSASSGAGADARVFQRAANGGPAIVRAVCPCADIDDMAFLASDTGVSGAPMRLAVLARPVDGASTLWVVEALADGARLTHRYGEPFQSHSLGRAWPASFRPATSAPISSLSPATFERPPFNNLDMDETGIGGTGGQIQDRSCHAQSTPCFTIETDLHGTRSVLPLRTRTAH
jgi:hypothetical protein